VASTLHVEGASFLIVERDPEAVTRATSEGYLAMQDDSTRDGVLHQAGIQQARGLVAALGDDADNTYVTLSAKGIRPGLLVVARANDEESESKLRRAGADRVILPLRLGAWRMAMLALNPTVVDFMETRSYTRDREEGLETIRIGRGSPVAGKTVKEAQDGSGGVAILALKRRDGTLLTKLAAEMRLQVGDELVAMGTREQLRSLETSHT